MIQPKPLRILQVVGGMNRGGAETWLMHVLRNIDRDRFQIDFLVHTEQECSYDAEIRALGSQVIPCLRPSSPLKYAHNFRRILKEHGPYDVVHSHVHHYSGYVLRLASNAAVPARIAHSHNDTTILESGANILRRGYLRLMKFYLDRYATAGLSVSREAAVALFTDNWKADPRLRLLYCCVDMAPFHQPVDRQAIRNQLGLPAEAFVIGLVARFSEQKNHEFLVKIAAAAAAIEPRTHLLLIGDGPLRPMIQQQVNEAGLGDRVIFAGLRSDVPDLLRSAMDLFVMPSLHEGLPLVGMEVQAAGLPMVISDSVTPETDVIPQLVHRLSLSQSPTVWAQTILRARDVKRSITPTEALSRMEHSPFNIKVGVKELEQVYADSKQYH